MTKAANAPLPATTHAGQRVQECAGLPWMGEVGKVDEALLKGIAAGLTSPFYYVAGPPAMVGAMRDAVGIAYHHVSADAESRSMCRNIKTLFNFEPPATELEIRDASLQFVRKLSGFNVPSKANEAAFERAVEEVAASARKLIRSLVTSAEPRTREAEAAKARERAVARFGERR